MKTITLIATAQGLFQPDWRDYYHRLNAVVLKYVAHSNAIAFYGFSLSDAKHQQFCCVFQIVTEKIEDFESAVASITGDGVTVTIH